MNLYKGLSILTFCTLLFLIPHVSAREGEMDLSNISLTEGFKIDGNATVADASFSKCKGTIYVSTFDAGVVYAVKDNNGDLLIR